MRRMQIRTYLPLQRTDAAPSLCNSDGVGTVNSVLRVLPYWYFYVLVWRLTRIVRIS